jgi:hypothetical protein
VLPALSCQGCPILPALLLLLLLLPLQVRRSPEAVSAAPAGAGAMSAAVVPEEQLEQLMKGLALYHLTVHKVG